MTSRMNRFLILCGISASLAACGGWSERTEWGSSGIWSDDEAAVVVFQSEFERKQDFGASHYRTRNHKTQLFRVNADLSSLAPVGPQLEGYFVGAHYMRSQGYILVERRGKQSESTEGTQTITREPIYWDVVRTADGSVHSVSREQGITMLGCNNDGGSMAFPGPIDVVPSPNGELLALFEFDASCSGTSGTLTFLNANDLSVASAPQPLRLAEFNASPMFLSFEEVWLSNAEIFAGFFGGFGPGSVRGYKYSLDGEPTAYHDFPQECMYQSNFLNSQGQRVDVETSTESFNASISADPMYQEPDCP